MSDLPPTFVPGFHDEESVRKMRYNPLGQTGLKVSHLSLGTGGLCSNYGSYDENEAIETIRLAIKSGINYIDTGPWYGQGESEEVLGKALKEIPRKAYYIGTKVGRYEKQFEKMFDFSAEKTRWSVDNSLKKLGLDYVDVIQVHDIEFANTLDQVLNETLPTLEEIVKEGKAHYIGITGYPVSILKECIQKSKVHIATLLSYTRMSLIDDTLQEFMLGFNMQGVGVINAAAPSMGLLTNNGPPEWHPADQQMKDICKQAGDYCKAHNVELGRLAMHHSFIQQGPATHLVGINSLALLKSNMDILHNGLNDNEKEVLKDIKEKFFSKLQQHHWEGVEIKRYREIMGL